MPKKLSLRLLALYRHMVKNQGRLSARMLIRHRIAMMRAGAASARHRKTA
jgi:hypothetical protein